jgi:hypothetical protein
MKSLGFISAAWFAVVGATVGFLGGSLLAAAIGFGIALLFGVVFGWAIVSAEAYEPTVASVLLFIVDHTWSLANTVAGAVYLAGNLVFGNRIDRDVSRHTGAVQLANGIFPGYLTTIGTVIAGVDTPVHAHEHGHVMQARIFGPLYLPMVIANYVIATIAPYWLLYHDRARYPINSFRTYFLDGVYPHVWNEAWCYAVYGPAR